MVSASAHSMPALSFPEYTSQSHSYPFVRHLECLSITMSKVFKPASQAPVEIVDYALHAFPGSAPRLLPDAVFELLHTFVTRPSGVSLKVVSQKVESPFCGRVNYPRLFWVQGQSSFFYSCRHEGQSLICFFLCGAQYHSIVGISDHFIPLEVHLMV
jgi:hypothetical protein